MPRVQEIDLSLGALEQMDSGKIARLVKSHLQKLSADCLNRPADDTARTMNVEFSFTPVLDPDSGDCETAKLRINVKSKVPTFRSKSYECRVGQKGFSFNQDFPDDLDQPALFPKSQSEPKE